MMLLLALALQPTVGQVLVATERSRDPDLARSVVLVIHSDSDGVMGLLLNRPRGKSTNYGGPIHLGTRTLVHGKQANAEKIVAGVYMGSDTKDAGARVYTGYAGWSAQQLIDEISRGLWKVVAGNAGIVFDPHVETLWRRLSGSLRP